MNLIPALLEDLLKKLSEKDLEMPLRSLLRSLGHSLIFERTHHGPGEHGKDIVSVQNIDGVQTVNIFTLKTRDISASRFRTEVRPVFDPMIKVPIHHPMVKGDELSTYTLVSTGDLTREAAEEFESYNVYNQKTGMPEIQLWNRSKLVSLFSQNLESIPAFSHLHDNLARTWLSIKSGKYNRSDWFEFVGKVTSSEEEAEQKSLLFLGLATSLIVSQARLQDEIFVSLDVSRISLVEMWSKVVQQKDEGMTVFDSLHEELCGLIEDFVNTRKDVLLAKEGLFQGDKGAVESILYPIRTFYLLEALSYVAYCSQNRPQKEKEYVDLIKTIINSNPSSITPPTDSVINSLAIVLAELCRNQENAFAAKWIENILENLYQRYIRSGWWPSVSDKPDDIIEHTFHFKEGTEEKRKEQPESFLIPVLFHFCSKLRAKRIYDRYRVLFDAFRLLEFVPPDNVNLAESELIKGTLMHGSTIERRLPTSFDDYCEQVSQITFRRYTPIEKNRPHVLQLITDVHSNYAFPEIYLNF